MTKAFYTLVLCVLMAACGGDPEPGESCQSDDECGSLFCVCQGPGEIPGVCTPRCTEDEQCASYGEGYTCVIDFCTGQNACLRNFSRSP